MDARTWDLVFDDILKVKDPMTRCVLENLFLVLIQEIACLKDRLPETVEPTPAEHAGG